MFSVLIVIHLLITLALIIVVLLQRSEGGGLGIGGGGGGGMGGLMTTRGTANLLTRVTAVLAGCFMAMSLLLAVLSGGQRVPRTFIDTPAATQPVLPPTPSAPAAPLAR